MKITYCSECGGVLLRKRHVCPTQWEISNTPSDAGVWNRPYATSIEEATILSVSRNPTEAGRSVIQLPVYFVRQVGSEEWSRVQVSAEVEYFADILVEDTEE